MQCSPYGTFLEYCRALVSKMYRMGDVVSYLVRHYSAISHVLYDDT